MALLSLYLLSALVMWIPACLSLRRLARESSLTSHAFVGLLVAFAWPLTMPALSLTVFER